MADSIYRIMPTTSAPERVAVTRRQRDEKQRRGPPERERQGAGAGRAQEAIVDAEAPPDRPKGQRLDINA